MRHAGTAEQRAKSTSPRLTNCPQKFNAPYRSSRMKPQRFQRPIGPGRVSDRQYNVRLAGSCNVSRHSQFIDARGKRKLWIDRLAQSFSMSFAICRAVAALNGQIDTACSSRKARIFLVLVRNVAEKHLRCRRLTFFVHLEASGDIVTIFSKVFCALSAPTWRYEGSAREAGETPWKAMARYSQQIGKVYSQCYFSPSSQSSGRPPRIALSIRKLGRVLCVPELIVWLRIS